MVQCYHSSMKEITVVISFLVILLVHGQCVVLNLAIVEMVVKHKYNSGSGNCKELINTSVVSTNIGDEHYNWSEVHQAIILFSYYLGIGITQLTSGYICIKFGSRRPLLIGFTLTSICTLITPPLTKYVYNDVLIGLRVITGMCHGLLNAGVHHLLRSWNPWAERQKIETLVGLSRPLCVHIGILLSGTAISYGNGWSIGFYFWGVFGLCVMMLFAIYVYSEPIYNPFINEIELDNLEKTIRKKISQPLQWKKVLRDKAIWALIIGQTGRMYVWFMLLTYLPKYIDNVLHYNFDDTSVLYALPFLVEFFGSILCAVLNYYILKRSFKPFLIRKIIAMVSGVLLGTCFITVTFILCCPYLAMLNLCVGLFFSGIINFGLYAAILEYTHNYTSRILALTKGCGIFSGIACMIVTSQIFKKNNILEWRTLIYTLVGVELITLILFVILGPNKHASWDYREERIHSPSASRIESSEGNNSGISWFDKPKKNQTKKMTST